MQYNDLPTSLRETILQFSPGMVDDLMTRRISTGFSGLDQALGGGLSPGLYVLGAIPNLGKSTFALQIAQSISARGTPVLFFSMEMPASRIASKLLCRRLYLNTGDPRYTADALLDPESLKDTALWAKITAAREQMAKECEDLYVIQRGRRVYSASDVAAAVDRFMDQKIPRPKPVVMVDYLQILSADRALGPLTSDRAVVDSNIQTLTDLAARRQIPVFVISAFNRTNYQAPVSMEAFKESGAIEYAADVILGMQLRAVGSRTFDLNAEKAKNPRELEIMILKQRYGVSGEALHYRYYAANDHFEEDSESGRSGGFFPELPERSLDTL